MAVFTPAELEAVKTYVAVKTQAPVLNHHMPLMTSAEGSATLLVFSCKIVVEESLHCLMKN